MSREKRSGGEERSNLPVVENALTTDERFDTFPSETRVTAQFAAQALESLTQELLDPSVKELSFSSWKSESWTRLETSWLTPSSEAPTQLGADRESVAEILVRLKAVERSQHQLLSSQEVHASEAATKSDVSEATKLVIESLEQRNSELMVLLREMEAHLEKVSVRRQLSVLLGASVIASAILYLVTLVSDGLTISSPWPEVALVASLLLFFVARSLKPPQRRES